MENYLLPVLNQYFEEVVHIGKRLLITASFIQTRTNELLADTVTVRQRPLFEGITMYRDFSLIAANDNLFLPKPSFEVYLKDLPK